MFIGLMLRILSPFIQRRMDAKYGNQRTQAAAQPGRSGQPAQPAMGGVGGGGRRGSAGCAPPRCEILAIATRDARAVGHAASGAPTCPRRTRTRS